MGRVMSLSDAIRYHYLLAAIRKHRDQRGDDRCWLDDEELYSNLPEGHTKTNLALHCPKEMLENCKKFIASRQPEGLEYVSPQREIEKLKKENEEIKEELKRLQMELQAIGYERMSE